MDDVAVIVLIIMISMLWFLTGWFCHKYLMDYVVKYKELKKKE